MSNSAALDAFDAVRETQDTTRLDRIDSYLRTDPERNPSWLPNDAPPNLAKIARIAHVPILGFVLRATYQSLYVDGYQTTVDDDGEADDPGASLGWEIWQRNQMNKRQIGIHKAGNKYGTSYSLVLPGTPVPVFLPRSPRKLTVAYADDPRWPMFALDQVDEDLWKLYDEESVYTISTERSKPIVLETEVHGAGVCPAVRYQPDDDLDDHHPGMVEPLFDLQDQIDLTTFSLKVAEHFGAHRQRYVIGWLAESETQAMKTAASSLWQFEQGVEDDGTVRDIKVGEFEQTQLGGYLESREATLRHTATISQTPVHELSGQLVNLSAEALVAARDSHERMNTQIRVCYGESHEQLLGKGTELADGSWDPLAGVNWRDMAGRSLSQTADALGKFVDQLHVPAEAMWERIPGVDQGTIKRWRRMAAEGDSIGMFREFLESGRDTATGDSDEDEDGDAA